jgi:hypothetical protein
MRVNPMLGEVRDGGACSTRRHRRTLRPIRNHQSSGSGVLSLQDAASDRDFQLLPGIPIAEPDGVRIELLQVSIKVQRMRYCAYFTAPEKDLENLGAGESGA